MIGKESSNIDLTGITSSPIIKGFNSISSILIKVVNDKVKFSKENNYDVRSAIGENEDEQLHQLFDQEEESLNNDIKTVYSHPQSLMQSARYLSENNWRQISMQNNAFAAKKVAEDKDFSQAAVASELAGKLYGLDVIKKGVNNSGTNSTRFIIVTNQKIFMKDANKISICFEVPHESGSLYHMLSHFIYNNLNMTKIESRPIDGRDWEYRFFIDIEGNLADGAVKNALRGLRDEAANMKILGNYKGYEEK